MAFQGITAIRLESAVSAYGRPYERVCIVMYDLHLYKDINSERDLRLIERLASDTGVDVVDNRRALAVTTNRG